MDERSSIAIIDGVEYEMVLSTTATKKIGGKYGGLENLGDKLMKSENFEMAIDEVVWLITLLCNQGISIYNFRNPDKKKPLLTEEMVGLLTTPYELAGYKAALTEAMVKGTKRNILSEAEGDLGKTHKSVHAHQISNDDETFTRLLYYGTVQLNRTEEEVWLMPIGKLLDLWECHKQFTGMSKPKVDRYIDDIIPFGI